MKNKMPIIAIWISILAIVIALVAWTNVAGVQNSQKDSKVEVLEELEQLRNDFAQNTNYERALTKIEQIRTDLNTDLKNQVTDNDLSAISEQLKQKAVNVLETIDALIAKLKINIRR